MGTHLKDRWLLPEGVEEALPEQAMLLETSRRQLIDLYQTWGYELVMPPLIEYLESLLTGTGQDLDLQTFKLTDQLNGRMMGVRADLTPQVARIDAHRIKSAGPTRLCYLGTALRTRPDGMGGSRSPLQVGAELYGYAGVDADVEIVSLLIETLKTAGVEGIHLDLGHVGFLKSLSQCFGFDDAAQETFYEMLQRKAVTEIKTWLATQDLSESDQTAFLAIPLLCGDKSVLEEAKQLFAESDSEVLECITSLETLVSSLEGSYPEVSFRFDLSELRGFNYETGIVFAAYVKGQGDEIARGGRYDGIGKDFGRDRPAVGFSADLKRLMSISSLSLAKPVKKVFAPNAVEQSVVTQLRKEGVSVIRELTGQEQSPSEMGCDSQLVLDQGQWVVMSVVVESE